MSRYKTALKLLAIFFSIVVSAFFVYPTWNLWSTRRQVSHALIEAVSVRFEEYSQNPITNHILSSVELIGSQRDELVESLPPRCQIGCPGLIVLRCFVPHHRLVITAPNGEELVLRICFCCDQYAMKGKKIQAMPEQWSKNIRSLFRKYKVDIKESYGKIDSELMNHDMDNMNEELKKAH